jgi:hypothetical protein
MLSIPPESGLTGIGTSSTGSDAPKGSDIPVAVDCVEPISVTDQTRCIQVALENARKI